ncbi:MAG: hypothetical protein IRZ07_03840 [Microbispora sp.]|nr:hypothetical protein [Microbispora sp.]
MTAARQALALLRAGDRAEAMAALEGAEGDRQQAALALLRAGPAHDWAVEVLLESAGREARRAA